MGLSDFKLQWRGGLSVVKLQGGGLRLEEGVQKRWLAGTLLPSKPPCSWNATKLFRLLVAMAVIISRVGDAAEAKRENCSRGLGVSCNRASTRIVQSGHGYFLRLPTLASLLSFPRGV